VLLHAGASAASTGPPQPAAAAVEAFWLQLPQATVDGKVLRLAGGTTFLGSSKLPGFMYIRDDYGGLWAEIQRLVSSGLSRIVISGNPGIGKSWFGLYIAFMLLSGSEPVTIVWESRRRSSRTLIQNGQVFRGNLEAFVSELEDTRTWYLVDEAVPPGATEVEARTLVFSSPKRENYKDTLKAPASTIRYMPVWSWAEIEACHSCLYAADPERPLPEVRAAFEHWGGVPRYVLEKLRDEAAQQSLQEALDAADVGAIRKAIGQIDAAPEASHRILHIVTQRPYVSKSIAFGSAYIRNRLAELLFSEQRQAITDFLVGSASSPQLAGVRGDLFEAFAHRVLSGGGAFPVRSLDDGAESTLQLSSCAGTHPVRSPSDLAQCPSSLHYCQPTVRNFPAVDSAILPRSLFQMTVSPSHPVKHAALTRVLDSMPDARCYDLYFVVPDDVYPQFVAVQPFVRSDDETTAVAALDARVQRVKQWALCVRLQS
jgi:hypothetical protein